MALQMRDERKVSAPAIASNDTELIAMVRRCGPLGSSRSYKP